MLQPEDNMLNGKILGTNLENFNTQFDGSTFLIYKSGTQSSQLES